jgi:hypothetical protein
MQFNSSTKKSQQVADNEQQVLTTMVHTIRMADTALHGHYCMVTTTTDMCRLTQYGLFLETQTSGFRVDLFSRHCPIQSQNSPPAENKRKNSLSFFFGAVSRESYVRAAATSEKKCTQHGNGDHEPWLPGLVFWTG